MRREDIDVLFDLDKWDEWIAKELRKLEREGCVNTVDLFRISLLAYCYNTLSEVILRTPEERCIYVKDIAEQCYANTGVNLEPPVLERLATWILAVDKDSDNYVLTDRQMRTRNREKEFPFHTPKRNNYAMELDGNRYVKPRPSMDSDEEQRVWVKMPSDTVDKRTYNGPLEKFLLVNT